MIRSNSSFMLFLTVLGLYTVAGGLVSLSQFDYVNADFVAYASIAQRTIEDPGTAVTAYWSSLFAWLMVPLFHLHVDDLVAGRVILLASGAVYLSAIYRLTIIHSYGDRQTHRLIQIGTMTCSLIQAMIWANYLLAPDLVANAILYIYFCVVSKEQPYSRQAGSCFVAGAIAGFAYLAKAYMLPFCCAHFMLSYLMKQVLQPAPACLTKQMKSAFLTLGLFGIGLGLVAGPWIVCLSQKCGRMTISTAGSSNHANMSPENFRNDPLWNPGLHADYIFEPGLTPDWSAFQDVNHFQHQLSIVWYNFLNCVGLIPVWLIFFAGCSAAVIFWKTPIQSEERQFLYWITMTVFVYCGGYTLVNLEARYIVPTVVPMLCYGSLLMIRSILHQPSESRSDKQSSFRLTAQKTLCEHHVAEKPHRHLARIRLSQGEPSTYRELRSELPTRAVERIRMTVETRKTSLLDDPVNGGSAVAQFVSCHPHHAESVAETIHPALTERLVLPSSAVDGTQGLSGTSNRLLQLFRSWPVCFVIGMIALLSCVDIHNLCRVVLHHPQATSMKQFRLIADQLKRLNLTDAPTACSHLHFGLFVAYASDGLSTYWGAPRSHSRTELPAELASKGIKVFLEVLTESELADRPSNKHPFGEDASWFKMATIRDRELLPNCLQVYVRR